MPDSANAPPEPTPEELEEILEDLDFFLAMDEAEAVPLETADDAEETDGD